MTEFYQITKKQIALIKDIEDELGVKFEGKTKAEAHMFISKHIQAFRDASVRDAWAIVNGYD